MFRFFLQQQSHERKGCNVTHDQHAMLQIMQRHAGPQAHADSPHTSKSTGGHSCCLLHGHGQGLGLNFEVGLELG